MASLEAVDNIKSEAVDAGRRLVGIAKSGAGLALLPHGREHLKSSSAHRRGDDAREQVAFWSNQSGDFAEVQRICPFFP